LSVRSRRLGVGERSEHQLAGGRSGSNRRIGFTTVVGHLPLSTFRSARYTPIRLRESQGMI
jgi:hypothetical protein